MIRRPNLSSRRLPPTGRHGDRPARWRSPGSLAAGMAFAFASTAALAQAAPRAPDLFQLWVAHGLLAVVAGIVAYGLARWWALGGMVVVVGLWYALAQGLGGTLPPAFAAHAQTSALMVPLAALAAALARRSRLRGLADASRGEAG